MTHTLQNRPDFSGPQVVATVHTPADLTALRDLPPGATDFLELRADALGRRASIARRHLIASGLPWILTCRDPREGGEAGTSKRDRERTLLDLMPGAAWIDVELRNAVAFDFVLEVARGAGLGVILSHHDFRGTPPAAKISHLAKKARDLGATMFKIAARTDTPAQLSRLLALFPAPPAHPVSAMGMGALGKASRPLLACAGSALNYGYLSKPNAPGQWPAPRLKELIAETREGR